LVLRGKELLALSDKRFVKLRLDGIDFNYIDIGKSDSRLDHYTPVIVANDDFLKNEPEKMRLFLAATAKGYQFAIENPDKAADMLLAAVPELDETLVRESQRFLAPKYQEESPAWGFIDGARWASYYRWAFDNDVLSVDLGEKGFTNEFLP
jgi:ABC-type nitrate/sulfonate/bicarbonate transport system substrate-binding protein